MENKFEQLNELLRSQTRLLQLYKNAVQIIPQKADQFENAIRHIKDELAGTHQQIQGTTQDDVKESIATESFIDMNNRNEIVYIKGQENDLNKEIEQLKKEIEDIKS